MNDKIFGMDKERVMLALHTVLCINYRDVELHKKTEYWYYFVVNGCTLDILFDKNGQVCIQGNHRFDISQYFSEMLTCIHSELNKAGVFGYFV